MRSADRSDIVELEGTRFDSGSGDLEGPAEARARLAPQPARLLELLVEHRGAVVSRDTIAAHLWPEGAVEADAGIGFAIREIRKGLEAVGGSPALIETLPRRGYRLRAPVTVPTPGSGPVRDEDVSDLSARASWWTRMLSATAAVVVVAALLYRGLGSEPPPVLAVFPYATVGDREASRDAAEELGAVVTVHLTRVLEDRVGIIGPTGIADLDGPNDTEGAAARGVCLVLSGSVRVVPDTGTIVFSQIVRTSDRVHLWARWDTVAPGSSRDALLGAIASGAAEARGDCR